jgi:hypothetical protein
LIANAHREADGSTNYRRFCGTIQNIYTNIALERGPQGHLKDSHKIVARTLNRVSVNEDAESAMLLGKMAHRIVTRGANVRVAYTDFDDHNTGTVTVSQFMRAMPFRDLSATELEILVKRYADPVLRDIHYRRLHNDLKEYIRTENLQNNPAARPSGPAVLLPHQRYSIEVCDFRQCPDEIRETFAKHLYEKRIRPSLYESCDEVERRLDVRCGAMYLRGGSQLVLGARGSDPGLVLEVLRRHKLHDIVREALPLRPTVAQDGARRRHEEDERERAVLGLR